MSPLIMPSKPKAGPLAIVAAMVGLVGGTAGGGAMVILPYRVEALEQKNVILEKQMLDYRELLIRIDENVKALKEAKRLP